MMIEITKVELDEILVYLTGLFGLLKLLDKDNKSPPTKLKQFIDKLESKKEVEEKPDSLELIITRLLNSKEKILNILAQKYKQREIDDVDVLTKILNKNEPELMTQLFFIDMELKNLGYNDTTS